MPFTGDLSVVSDVIRGAALSVARSPRRFPAWDLMLVLEYLRGPPFEPLETASLADLTKKTAFLISLALGRRSSEIASISGLLGDVSFEADGSVSLLFLPEFLAKNQRPGDPSPVLHVRPISDLVDISEDDCLNCPVRALKRYRRVSRRLRSASQRSLFLSVNPSYSKDIRRPTLARWLSGIIRDAYEHDRKKRGGGYVCLEIGTLEPTK